MSDRRGLLDAAERYLLAALMALVFLLLLTQVGARLAGTAAFGWVEEAARYLFIWLVFLGSGFAVRRGGHILADILRPKSNHVLAKCWLIVLEAILVAVSLGLLWYGGWFTSISSNTTMVSLGMSMAYRSAAVPVGATLMLLMSFANIVALVGSIRRAGPAEL
jgi:TRAP-type C4-dicarboxylate transport system permease small subunit